MNNTEKSKIQNSEYYIPYHYADIFAPGQSIAKTALVDFIKESIFPLANKKILDIGCGDGRTLYELKDECNYLEGIDMSEDALRWARAFLPNAKIHQGNFIGKFSIDEFDIILLIEVLEHIPVEDIPIILKEIKKILKLDGIFIITVPSKILTLIDKHYQHFSESSLYA